MNEMTSKRRVPHGMENLPTLPLNIVEKILQDKPPSEYTCHYSTIIKKEEPSEEPYTEVSKYSGTIRLELDPKLHAGYRQFVFFGLREYVDWLVNQYPNDRLHFVKNKGLVMRLCKSECGQWDKNENSVNGELKIIFRFFVQYNENDFAVHLGRVKEKVDEITTWLFTRELSPPDTPIISSGTALTRNTREHYKLKGNGPRFSNPNLEYVTELRDSFSFILVNNKEIAINKEDGLKMQQFKF